MLLKHFGSSLVTDGRKTRQQCKSVLKSGIFSYCEYYNHCKTIDCIEPVSLQKHHDFDFKLDYRPGVIVQYRKMEECLMSYYELAPRKINRKDFLKKLEPHYYRWVQKWVNSDNLCINYQDLVDYPKVTLKKVLDYLELPIYDMSFVDKIVLKNRRKGKKIA